MNNSDNLKNISPEMLTFKDVTRSIWNQHFSKIGLSNQETFDKFDVLERSLFWSIVIVPLSLDIDLNNYRRAPLKNLFISIKGSVKECPILLGYEKSDNRVVWQESVCTNTKDFERWIFFDFFDWDSYHQIDQPYIRFHIVGSHNDDEPTWGLLETRYVEFLYKAR